MGICQSVDCEWKNNERIIHNNNKTTDDVFNPAHNRGGWTLPSVCVCLCVQRSQAPTLAAVIIISVPLLSRVCVCVYLFLVKANKHSSISIWIFFYLSARTLGLGDMGFRFNRNNSPSLIFTLTAAGAKWKEGNAKPGRWNFFLRPALTLFSKLLLLFMGAQCECYIVVTLEWRRLYYLLLLIRIHRMQIMTLRGWIFIYFSRSATQEKSALTMINSINKCVSREKFANCFLLRVISGLCFSSSICCWCCCCCWCCEWWNFISLYTNTFTERGIDVHTVWMEEFWCQGIRFQIGGVIAYFSGEGKQNWHNQTPDVHTEILSWILANPKILYVLK